MSFHFVIHIVFQNEKDSNWTWPYSSKRACSTLSRFQKKQKESWRPSMMWLMGATGRCCGKYATNFVWNVTLPSLPGVDVTVRWDDRGFVEKNIKKSESSVYIPDRNGRINTSFTDITYEHIIALVFVIKSDGQESFFFIIIIIAFIIPSFQYDHKKKK